MAPSKPMIHVVAYPFPSSGHIIPMVELARRLVSRGIYVTVLITPSNLPLVEPLLSSHSPFLQSLLLPDPQEKKLFPLVSSMRLLHHPFLLSWWAHSPHSPSPPLALISDFFLGWTHHLASLLRIPRLVFSPSGASALSFSFSLWQHLPHNNHPDSLVPFPDLPHSPSYPSWQLNHYYRNNHKGHPEWDFHHHNMLDNIASSGIVINTFHHLEPLYLTHLQKTTHHGRVWAVGPVSSSRGGGPRHEVMTWLDSRPERSVIYVCFGSRTVLTGRQMGVVTGALEESGAQFVMAVREPDERHVGQEVGSIPEGFEERMKGRGVVIRGWCPQVDILGHPAVGSFLSHCGWNSVVESLAAGVVMVTWPMGADQYTNARLVVDEVGAGIRGGEGVTENVPEAAELSDVIKRSLQEEDYCRERVRAREMKRAALEAVEEGGTSHTHLDALLHYFSHLLPHPSS